MTSTEHDAGTNTGPVLFAYDGCGLSTYAIEQAAIQCAFGREALVVCVWQPADVGFAIVNDRHIDANNAVEVQNAAEETVAHGVSLAEKAGFRAQGLAVESAPTWKGIVETAEAHNASLIVIGSHRHKGLVGHLVGNVASAVVSHAPCSVLLVHQPHEH